MIDLALEEEEWLIWKTGTGTQTLRERPNVLDAKCTNGRGVAEPDTPSMPGVECVNEGYPARKELSEISDEGLPSPEERIVLYRELQQGNDPIDSSLYTLLYGACW